MTLHTPIVEGGFAERGLLRKSVFLDGEGFSEMDGPLFGVGY